MAKKQKILIDTRKDTISLPDSGAKPVKIPWDYTLRVNRDNAFEKTTVSIGQIDYSNRKGIHEMHRLGEELYLSLEKLFSGLGHVEIWPGLGFNPLECSAAFRFSNRHYSAEIRA